LLIGVFNEGYSGSFGVCDRISEVWGENEGVWKSLDAVKNDRVLQLDSYLFWGNDAISLKQQIQEIVKMLTGKTKQQP
jgi:iron complex transport system substrate-binding protein